VSLQSNNIISFITMVIIVKSDQVVRISGATICSLYARTKNVSIFGDNNTICVNASYIRGNGNSVDGDSNEVNGDQNTIAGNYCTIAGNDNCVVGSENNVIGEGNSENGNASSDIITDEEPNESWDLEVMDSPPRCVVCMDKSPSVRIDPCGHSSFCAGCFLKLNKNDGCPVCRGTITKASRIIL